MDTSKLAGILAKSKKVMRRSDEMKSKGEITGGNQTMSETMAQAAPQVAPQMESYNTNTPPVDPMGQQPIRNTFANKDTTRMPREIVEAMINNPIETPTLNNTFEASADLIEAVRGVDEAPRQQQQKQTTTTNVDGIREIIREELEKVIDQYIDKRLLDEEIQVKVGNTIFSGNLRPLPKKKVRKK